MIGENWPIIGDLLGIGIDKPAIWQMAARAILVYLAAIVLVRLGEKRFLGKFAALDVILGFMLGTVLAGAITSNSGFFETIFGAALILVLMHWLFAALAYRSDGFADIVKGTDHVLVRDGEIRWDAMQAAHITEKDLMMAVRSSAQLTSLDGVAEVRLERNGDVSVIEQDKAAA